MHAEIFIKTNKKVMTVLQEYFTFDSLLKRRKKFIIAYGQKCLTLEQTKELFSRNKNIDTLMLRSIDKYTVTQANTE